MANHSINEKKGWTNRMIAEHLGISEGTVKNYLSIIYKKN